MAIFKYNPQFLSPVERVRLFGGREHELAELVGILRQNLQRPRNQHVVVIGPRGMGKTTLLLRAVDEVAADPDLAAGWLPVIAPEESYRAGSIGGFWLEMVFSLARSSEDAQHEAAHQRLAAEFSRSLSMSDDRRLSASALAYLTDSADRAGRRLLLVVENLQMLLGEQLSSNDAWALRETLIGEPRIMLLGSAVSRFREIATASAPLFEQFLVQPLQPLDLDGCRDVWRRATGEDVPRKRMRALQILTGGSPRLLVILAGFAARRSLRELTMDLAALIDEHTDYLKMTTEALPDLERRVFVTLAEIWDWAPAAAVAAQARIDANVASAQLGRLEGKGGVTSRRKGRGKQYRVAERLYSIYHLMRRRGGAAARSRAALEFMAAYYEGPDLLGTVRAIAEEATTLGASERAEHMAFLATVLDSGRADLSHDDVVRRIPPALWACTDLPAELLRHLPERAAEPERGRAPSATASKRDTWPEELRLLIGRAEQAEAEGNAEEEIEAWRAAGDAAARLADGAPAGSLSALATVFLKVSGRQSSLGQRADALASITRAVEIYERLAAANPDAFLPDLAASLNNLSACQSNLGQRADALASITRAVEIYQKLATESPSAFSRAFSRARTLRAALLVGAGRTREASEALEEVLAADENNLEALQLLGEVHLTSGRHVEATACLATLVASDDRRGDRTRAAISVAVALARRQHAHEALSVLLASPLASFLEPLIVALRREAGEDVSAPGEIEEMAEDLRRQIREPGAVDEAL